MATNLWTDNINPVTGEHSLQEHRLRVVAEWCAPQNHYFEATDDVRLVCCTKCGYSVPFVIGYHQLKDGKLSKK